MTNSAFRRWRHLKYVICKIKWKDVKVPTRILLGTFNPEESHSTFPKKNLVAVDYINRINWSLINSRMPVARFRYIFALRVSRSFPRFSYSPLRFALTQTPLSPLDNANSWPRVADIGCNWINDGKSWLISASLWSMGKRDKCVLWFPVARVTFWETCPIWPLRISFRRAFENVQSWSLTGNLRKMQGNGEIGTNTRYKVRSLFIEWNYLPGILSYVAYVVPCWNDILMWRRKIHEEKREER